MTKLAESDGRLGKLDLHRALKCSRVTLDKYLNREDAPKPDEAGRYVVMDVVAYIQSQGANALPTGAQVDWRAKKLELECARLTVDTAAREHSLAVERGEYISKTEAAAIITPLMAELGAMLRQTFEVELPSQYTGKSLVEREQLNAAAVDLIIERVKTGTLRLTEADAHAARGAAQE